MSAKAVIHKAMTTPLKDIAKQLVAQGKGILAADESMGTCGKRFQKYGIPETAEIRRKWRELLFATLGIEEGLSGVILFDETIRQKTADGVLFAEFLASRGIIPGIKVDEKTEPILSSPEEAVTKGLDGLSKRFSEYAKMGAKFTKWRAVIKIGAGLPTTECIAENARRMAEYAFESQKAGLVPIPEPEVLLDGTHSMERCEEVIARTLKATFEEIAKKDIALNGLILKTSMVLPGKDSNERASAKEIAVATVRTLLSVVPREVAGVVFLSGGQSEQEATERLCEIVKEGKRKKSPWPFSFSYSRALQDSVMKTWAGKEENAEKAQEVFAKRVEETSVASRGEYIK